MPATCRRASAANSAIAHWPAIASRPNALRLDMARLTRDSRVRRPSRSPLSRWNSRCSADRYRLAASRQDRPVPGTPRLSRKTSASLPVFRMPSSVSTAASSVTSQSGQGIGPRSVGVDRSQVDQRSPSGSPSVASNAPMGGSRRRRARLAAAGSSSKRRLPRRRDADSSKERSKGNSRTGDAPRLSDGQGRRQRARDGHRHQAPPFRSAGHRRHGPAVRCHAALGPRNRISPRAAGRDTVTERRTGPDRHALCQTGCMAETEPKAVLHRYLQRARDAVLWKLDGLAEYDVRRPVTPTGTNLLGLVKHLAGIELGYFGDTFGRPSGIRPPWDEADPNSDMFAAPDESREFITGLYRRAPAHADGTIEAQPLDGAGRVPWWPAERSPVTQYEVLVHVTAETQRHAGHADIARELIDGAAGLQAGNDNLPSHEAAWWAAYRDRVERAARQAAAGP